MPMRRHVDYTPEFGRHTRIQALCATCHTLHTPVPGAGPGARSPSRRPTWSGVPVPTRAKANTANCHMQRLDEPIKVSRRPPWLEPRQPFWRRQVGWRSDTFMLQSPRENTRAAEPHASPEILATTIARAREQLRRAARIEVEGDRREPRSNSASASSTSPSPAATGHPY